MVDINLQVPDWVDEQYTKFFLASVSISTAINVTTDKKRKFPRAGRDTNYLKMS